MQVHYLNKIYKSLFTNPVATVGIFDGVHRGHVEILRILVNKAKQINGETVVITLWPHPRMVLYPGKEIKLLSTLDEKQQLLRQEGIDHLVIIPFDKDFAQIEAKQFISEILIDKIGIKSLLMGFDNHFGKNKEGSYDIIQKASVQYGFDLLHPSPVFEGRDRISSTDIRLFLELGEVESANKFLGYTYSLSGMVIKGKMLGRTIGYPTANIEPFEYKMLPRTGVYAVWVKTNGDIFKGMLNIGFRPTVDTSLKNKTIEVHIINYQGDLYDQKITVTFARRIRDEIKFNNIEGLIEQLGKDKLQVIEILDTLKKEEAF